MKNYYWKLSVLQCLLMIIIAKSFGQNKKMNLSFEKVNPNGYPLGWELSNGIQNDGYLIAIDSQVAQDGKRSLAIEKLKYIPNTFGMAAYTIHIQKNTIHKIKIVAYAKGNVKSKGEGVIYLNELDDGDHQLARSFVNIDSTDSWTQYIVEDFVKSEATNIIIGAALMGDGKIYVDNFQVYVDDKLVTSDKFFENITSVAIKLRPQLPFEKIVLNQRNTQLLTNIGMIWGLLKYYHPAITDGKYNWDNELLKILPSILDSTNKKPYTTIYNWIDQLGEVRIENEKKNDLSKNPLDIQPQYGNLFASNNLPNDLKSKLRIIIDNFEAPPTSYYISLTTNKNPSFTNEETYPESPYPDLGLRLISLFRYWNMINYFFPYRNLIGSDWNKTLTDYLPLFIHAKDKNEYTLACLRLIGSIHDTHANVYNNKTLDSIKGVYMSPFKAEFIENKLVVTDYYKDTLGISLNVHIGDVIDEIDGVSVDSLVKKYIDLSPASNHITSLRVLASLNGFLLRGQQKKASVVINHKTIYYERIPARLIPGNFDFMHHQVKEAYKLVHNNIGYINPAKLKGTDLSEIRNFFKDTKGLVFDFRCYPSFFTVYVYAEWLKSQKNEFLRITGPSLNRPGAINFLTGVYNGLDQNDCYKNKIVFIVNETTQSSAEYQTMALSSRSNSVVIGSTTAGADGDISKIILPGNIYTLISGLGIYYPDGKATQRVGLKRDITITPTITGIKNGQDELLDKAVEIIENDK
ncbi:S41 family peptidase [Rhizosphaericola mali]|uniref:Tail specific protease domain-containing protein n=1 Tax=Rhizosphaericola mali TaxID=2545455 RepID=A0A5P2G0S0_9BACT|nr:S41 family peptidase [Rhizosphaericola mali]QES89404.1 hypothetical protein E0W69_012265 [Rhizosphaericola mali]